MSNANNGTYLSVRVENLLREFANEANPGCFDASVANATMALCELFYDELKYKYRIRGTSYGDIDK